MEFGKHLQPVIIATMKRDPAKFPQNVTNQCISIFQILRRRWSTETVVYMNEPVHRSDPVRTTMVRP
jgi:hypothetical protein